MKLVITKFGLNIAQLVEAFLLTCTVVKIHFMQEGNLCKLMFKNIPLSLIKAEIEANNHYKLHLARN